MAMFYFWKLGGERSAKYWPINFTGHNNYLKSDCWSLMLLILSYRSLSHTIRIYIVYTSPVQHIYSSGLVHVLSLPS